MNLDDLPDEQCGWCKKGYMPRTYNQKFCSSTCREESANAFERQWRRAAMDKLKCQHCGDPIVAAKKQSTRYCSKTCQNAARTVREHGPLSSVKCCDCGKKIPGIIRRDTKRCPSCVRADHRKRNRERARLKRQEAHSTASVASSQV